MAQRPDAGSELVSSPPAFLGQTRSSKPIPKRLFCIPSEQQKLLDDGSSWAGALYSRPQRVPNVPAAVLNDIEDYHTRSRKHSKKPTQSSVPTPSQPKSSRSTGCNSNVEGKGRDDKPGNDESEDDVIAGWSSSPERDLQFKRYRELSPEQPPISQASVADRRSPPKTSTPQRDTSPEQPFASQLPEDDGCAPPTAPSSRAVAPRRDASSEPTFVTQQSATKVPASPSEASVPRRSASPEQPFASQPPTRFPPPSTNGALNRPQRRTACFNSFPPSSSGPEEDLEVVPPAAYKDAALLARGPPALNPTPPSAQVQVPCTAGFKLDSPMAASPPKKPKTGNRSRYKRADVSGLLNDPIPKALPETVSGLRRPPTNTKSNHHVPDSSTSDDFASSSIIPSTHPGKPHSTPVKSSLSKPIVEETQRPALQSSLTSDASPARCVAQLRPLSPVLARPLAYRTEVLSPQRQQEPTWSSPATETVQHRGTQRPPYSVLPATLPDTSPPGNSAVQTLENSHSLPPMPQAEILGSPPGGMVQPTAPFIQYALNYPSYTGSITDFLGACSYVQVLQRRRALASYSYDDFIRAWYQGYLPYIKSLSGSTKEPMTAIEWYMESVTRMEFKSGIVTKENLESIMTYYQPEEVRRARQRVPVPTQDSLATKVSSGTQSQSNIPCTSSGLRAREQPAVQPHSPPNVEELLSLAHSPVLPGQDRNRDLGRAVVEATPVLGSQRQSQSDPVDKTADDTTTPGFHQESFRRSVPARDSRKRDAEDDGILPARKMARGQNSEQDATSTTSNRSDRLMSGRSSFSGTPRSTGYKGPKKYIHNLAKRRESLEKHFAKSLGKRSRDSIVSSSMMQQDSEADSARNGRE